MIMDINSDYLDTDDSPKAPSMADVVRDFTTFDTPPPTNEGFSHLAPLLVVLTGATGLLGAHILNTIHEHPAVSQIICLVRGKSEDHCKTRVSAALLSRNLPPIANSDKIKCFPLILGSQEMGVAPEVLRNIRSQRVSFIHV